MYIRLSIEQIFSAPITLRWHYYTLWRWILSVLIKVRINGPRHRRCVFWYVLPVWSDQSIRCLYVSFTDDWPFIEQQEGPLVRLSWSETPPEDQFFSMVNTVSNDWVHFLFTVCVGLSRYCSTTRVVSAASRSSETLGSLGHRFRK